MTCGLLRCRKTDEVRAGEELPKCHVGKQAGIGSVRLICLVVLKKLVMEEKIIELISLLSVENDSELISALYSKLDSLFVKKELNKDIFSKNKYDNLSKNEIVVSKRSLAIMLDNFCFKNRLEKDSNLYDFISTNKKSNSLITPEYIEIHQLITKIKNKINKLKSKQNETSKQQITFPSFVHNS